MHDVRGKIGDRGRDCSSIGVQPKAPFLNIFPHPVLTYAQAYDILRRESVDAVGPETGPDAHTISRSHFGASPQNVAMRYS